MRDRLIELVCEGIQTDECIGHCNHPYCHEVERIADHLLANGVIVLPCKVWDTVYYLTSVDVGKELNIADIFCGTVQSVAFDGKNIWIAAKYTNGLYYHHKAQDFGRDVFLNPEKAAKALVEREGKG